MRRGLVAVAALGFVLSACGSTAAQPVSEQTPAAAAPTTAAPVPTPTLTTAKPTPTPKPTTAKPTPTKTAKPKPTPSKTKKAAAPAAVYYKNCDAVRAAGADPIYAGDPGYSRKLDRDGDGVACE